MKLCLFIIYKNFMLFLLFPNVTLNVNPVHYIIKEKENWEVTIKKT